MARNGSGTYTLPEAAFVNGTVIDEVAMNSNFSDIETEITNSVDKDGQTTWTGNMNAGSNKITNMAVGSASTDSARYDQTIAGGKLNATAGFGSVAHTDGIVHIQSATAGTVTAHADADELIIEGTGNIGLSFLSPNVSSLNSIHFGDTDNNAIGSIAFSHSNNVLSIASNDNLFRIEPGWISINHSSNDHDLRFKSTSVTNAFICDAGTANIHINNNTNTTSSASHLHIGIGTSPTAVLANGITIGAKDSSAGATDATVELWLETAPIAVGTFTASHKFPIWINGTEYHIQLDAV